MNSDLQQVASTAFNLHEYIETHGDDSDWLLIEKQAKLILDHIRMANNGKLPSEM